MKDQRKKKFKLEEYVEIGMGFNGKVKYGHVNKILFTKGGGGALVAFMVDMYKSLKNAK